MDATPIDSGPFGPPGDGLTLAPPPREASDVLVRKWTALHDAADVVGDIAGLPAGPTGREIERFPARIAATGGWRQGLAEQGIEDLTAIMEPGISALLSAHARGVHPVAAARALLREFIAARDALLTLVPPPAS